jgi:hypothetical protein
MLSATRKFWNPARRQQGRWQPAHKYNEPTLAALYGYRQHGSKRRKKMFETSNNVDGNCAQRM